MNRRAFLGGVLSPAMSSAEEPGPPGFWQNERIRSCCSEADAVYADDWGYRDGKLFATVTGGGPRNHAWAPIGREYEIPESKLLREPHDPKGHAILFLVPPTPQSPNLDLRCFVMPSIG